MVFAFGPVLKAKEVWLTARTANFELYSNASEKDSRKLLENLERFRAVLLAGLKLPPGREPPTRVVAFNRDRDFENYRPRFNGKARKVSGFFSGGEDVSFIAVLLGRDQDAARRLIYHEYVHQLFANHGLKLPLWLNEGLAEFYSTFEIKKGEVVLGRPIDSHVKFLRRVSRVPLAEIMRVKQDSKDYNEGFRVGVFYAKSWALVHLMFCGNTKINYSSGIGRYISLLKDGKLSDPERFRQSFGVDYAMMDKELARYLMGGRFYLYRGEVAAVETQMNLEFKPVDPVMLKCTQLQLLWASRKSEEVTYQLLLLGEKHPTVARIPEALGSIAWNKNDRLQALSYWREAVKLGSDNPYYYVKRVTQTLRDILNNGNLDYKFPSHQTVELRATLLKALDLNPDYAQAFELLAWVEVFSSKLDVANINLIQRNTHKLLDLKQIYLALAIIRWRLGDMQTARELVQVLKQVPGNSMPDSGLLDTLAGRVNQ